MIDSGLMNVYKLVLELTLLIMTRLEVRRTACISSVLELTLLIMTTYHHYNSCDVHKHITLCD